jgi:isoquinoline 1-oxidoreductase beta subunit
MTAPKSLTICAGMTETGGHGFVLTGQAPPKGGLESVWLTVHGDGQVVLMLNKTEMGQGISTGLALIVAEELDADAAKVGFIQAGHDPRYNDPGFGAMLTGGSTSVRNMILPLRKAAAAAREMLKLAAARRLGVDASELATELGFVVYGESRIAYGELAAEAASLPAPPELEDPPLKDPKDFRYLGKCATRLDVPDKVAGKAVFGNDVRLPGMRFAAVAWPKAYGAAPVSWDVDAAKAVSGVTDVVETGFGPAVLAANTWAAWQGRDALNVQWSPGAQPDMTGEALYGELEALLDADGITAVDQGDAAALAESSTRKVSLTFLQPFLAHAPIEPMNCTAHVRPNGVEIWGPTQFQTGWAQEAAKVSGQPIENVSVHTTMAGGGFGRKAMLDCVRLAVAVSKAFGEPVQVLYSRPEEFHYDYLRPGNASRVEAGLAEDGGIAFWRQKNASASVLAELMPFMLAESGLDFTGVEGVDGMDYAIPAVHVEWRRHMTPVPIGFWRSVGNSQNCFVRESVMDELAHLAGEDPLSFRLRHLDAADPDAARARGVLELAAEKFGWGRDLPQGHAAGLAYEHSFGSFLAQITEISLDEAGKPIIHRVVTAIDCGQTINPLSVVMQVEGGLTMGLSALMGEEMRFEGGGAASKNFGDYKLLRMGDSPLSMETYIVDSTESPGGVGEPGLPGVLPAVANAVRMLTGERVTRLPLASARK